MRARTVAPRALALLVVLPSLAGCAFLNGSHQTVRVSSNVPARIYAGPLRVAETDGHSETRVQLRRGEQHVLVAKAEGYEDMEVGLVRRINALGSLDLIGAILIAVPVVTFATGHAYSIEPRSVSFELEPATP